MDLPKKLLTRKDEITSDFIKLVDQYVNDLLNRKGVTRQMTSDFAALLFIAPRHLTNTIKLTTGKSPCEVIEDRFYDEAGKLLLHTELTITDISYLFGYGDTTNFIKFFKGMSGVTPLQFRKKAKLVL